MRDYDSAGIRNIAVVGHGASGKTSLVDALCFAAGSGKRHGSIKDGTALTDHLPEEIERGFLLERVERSALLQFALQTSARRRAGLLLPFCHVAPPPRVPCE